MDSTTEISSDLKERAIGLAKRTEVVSANLSKRARARSTVKSGVDLVSFVVGVAAIVVSLSPDIRTFLGRELTFMIVSLSGISLLGGLIVDRILLKDPPERFKDYSFYIGMYTEQIRDLVANSDNKNRISKLEVILDMCGRNIADTRRNWPDLVPEQE